MDKNCDNCINSGRPSYEWPCTACTTAHGSAPSKWESNFAKDTNDPSWISVSERLPEPEAEVLVLAERRGYSFRAKSVTTHHIVTTGMYEDGTKNTEDSNWYWETDGFEYDEELDAYIIPEGWWEYKHYNGDDENNHAIDDRVTHWMPLPEPPK